MLRLALAATLLATPACAQKPDPAADARERRGDSLIARPADLQVDLTREAGDEIVAPPPPGTVRTDTTVVQVGDTPVAVVTHTVWGPDRRADAFWAVNLHDDESTSVEAALAVAAKTGGVVVELVHSGDRNLSFTETERIYLRDGTHRTARLDLAADPNRMFTPAGLARTLDALSDGPMGNGAALVGRLAEHVLTRTGLDEAAVVVTLHNNTPDNYSATSYAPGAEYAVDAEAVTVVPGSDPDDFFFVTDRGLYDALVARGFNAVLQDNARATDDGSLSVWAAQNGRPYVNVEAQHGHVAEQTRMIQALVEVLTRGE